MSFEHSQSKYVLLSKVGGGVYGDVYKAKNIQTDGIVAIKKIKRHPHDQGISSVALREMAILQTIQHENIVKLLDIEYLNSSIRIVMEFYEKDLDAYIKQTTLDSSQQKSILQGILQGMEKCHKLKCMHRDLKPQNILMNQQGQPKLCDFGMARLFQKNQDTFTQEVITLWYRPPELLLGIPQYSTAVDMWSIGCIFGQMILGEPMFQGDSEISQMKLICNHITMRANVGCEQSDIHLQLLNQQYQLEFEQLLDFRFKEKQLSQEGLDLIKKLLMLNPMKRINCTEALKHPYFNIQQEIGNFSDHDQNGSVMQHLMQYFKILQ